MTSPTLTFFNNKGGVGKTSLIYHLAWMFASMDKLVVVADLDPQANLTAAFLDEERVEAIWNSPKPGSSIYQCVKPLLDVGDIAEPILQPIATNLYLLPGDVNLSRFEETLSGEWANSMSDDNLYRPMRILSAFWQVMQMAADKVQADIVLVDISPNLGAINRSALIATDYVIIPLGEDLASLQSLRNLGPTLKIWQNSWQQRLSNWRENNDINHHTDFRLPDGKIQPVGYLCQQHSIRLDRPMKAYDKWTNQIPAVYRESVLGETAETTLAQAEDPYCLATIKHYRSLMPMAQEYRKPVFNLTPADGAIGSHASAVQDARSDFRRLAILIAGRIGLDLSA